jgi:hypothetical protein
MGSIGIAARIAQVAFWGLLLYGWVWDEIDVRGIAVFVALWIAGLYGLPLLSEYGAGLCSSYSRATCVSRKRHAPSWVITGLSMVTFWFTIGVPHSAGS